MAKAKAEKRNPRLVKRGDVVRVDSPLPGGGEVEEVVRKVEVLLHLSNGYSVSIDSASTVDVIPDTEITEELRNQITELLAQQG